MNAILRKLCRLHPMLAEMQDTSGLLRFHVQLAMENIDETEWCPEDIRIIASLVNPFAYKRIHLPFRRYLIAENLFDRSKLTHPTEIALCDRVVRYLCRHQIYHHAVNYENSIQIHIGAVLHQYREAEIDKRKESYHENTK